MNGLRACGARIDLSGETLTATEVGTQRTVHTPNGVVVTDPALIR